MKKIVLLTLFTMGCPITWSAEYMTELESTVFPAEGTSQEIAKRAKTCALEVLVTDEVAYSDSASQGMFTNSSQDTSASAGGSSILLDVDIEAGKVIANSRFDFTDKMIKKNVQSRVAIMARDERFKIRHTNIKQLQKSTGYAKNSGYTKVGIWWGSGHKGVTYALNSVSQNLANCIQRAAATEDDDW
jgi:hypothetical protein